MKSLNAPVIEVDSLKTKFDKTVVSNSLIALLDYSYEEARFLQQLHYWSYSEYGVVIDGIRWIFKSAKEWINEALVGLTEWKLRRVIASLLEKNLIRKEKLYVKHHEQEYQARWWNPKNQTCYYSINYGELEKLIEEAEITGAVRFEETTKTKVCELSRTRTKNTNHKKETTKQESDRLSNKSESIAAASPTKAFKEKKSQTGSNPHSSGSTTSPSQIKQESEATQSNPTKDKSSARIDCIINKEWKSLISVLDSVGIPINKTLKDLLKLYPSEKVENAIAIVKARKREQHIPNLSGYFVSALKGDWASQNIVSEEEDQVVDQSSIFRHWYDLSRELGYCSGQEVRSGEQWVCLTGSWEKWESAVQRGYSLSYLKKIIKRNNGG